MKAKGSLNLLRVEDFLTMTTDAVIVVNQVQEIILFNQSAEQIFGYSVSEILGQPIHKLLPEPFALMHSQYVQNFLASGDTKRPMSSLKEISARRKDGSEFPIEASIARIKRENQTLLAVFLRDITWRKHAERDLVKWANAFEHAEWGVVIGEANANQLQLMNPAFAKMYGYSIEELTGKDIRDVYAPEDRDKVPHWIQLAHKQGHINFEARHIRKDGSIFPVQVDITAVKDANNNVLYRVVHVQDITQRKNTELALRESQQENVRIIASLEESIQQSTRELSALLEVSRNLTASLELAPLLKTILEQLKHVVEYTGAAIARLDGDKFTILEYLGPVPREEMLAFHVSATQDTGYQRVALTRKPFIIDDMWKDDPWLHDLQRQTAPRLVQTLQPYHSWMGVPLISQDQLLGVLRIDHIQPNFFTERHAQLVMSFANQAAIALHNANLYQQAQTLAALEERQRLARELHDSVSQALYGVALGVRTARTLLTRDPLKAIEPLDYCLSLAESGMAEMRALIFELRPESLEVEGIVSALYKQAAAFKARNSFQVHTQFSEEPDVSLAIKEVLYRIALEALNNITKHAHATSIQIRMVHSDGALELEIQDDGIGYDTSQSFAGHLGLHTMRERAEQIDGKLEVTSAPGKGTRVRLQVQLPFE